MFTCPRKLMKSVWRKALKKLGHLKRVRARGHEMLKPGPLTNRCTILLQQGLNPVICSLYRSVLSPLSHKNLLSLLTVFHEPQRES